MFDKNRKVLPPPTSELDGIELKIRLSSQTILRLVSIAIAVLFGSGVLAHTATSISPIDTGAQVLELSPKDNNNNLPN